MWLSKQTIVIMILVLLNATLVVRHLEVLKKCSWLNNGEYEVILDEEKFSGDKIPQKIMSMANKLITDKFDYFFKMLKFLF